MKRIPPGRFVRWPARLAWLLLVVSVAASCADRSEPPSDRAAPRADHAEPRVSASIETEPTPTEPTETEPTETEPTETEPIDTEPVRERPLLHGVDVSYHSGAVDWQEVRDEGHSYAILKATEGVDLADPSFAAHWRALGDLDMVRGAYHFFVTEDDPEEQARFFLSTVDFAPGDLAPVVDIELIGHGTSGELAPKLRRFLEVVEAEVGVRPIIYTAPKFWDQHFDDTFGEYPLWVAEYGVDEPRLPAGWDRWHLWQWQGDAAVAGVEKGADLNRTPDDGQSTATLLIPDR